MSRGRVHSDCEVSVLGDEDLTAHTRTRGVRIAHERHTQRNSTYVASVSTQITGAPAPSCLERVTSERMYPSALAWHSPWPARVAHHQARGSQQQQHSTTKRISLAAYWRDRGRASRPPARRSRRGGRTKRSWRSRAAAPWLSRDRRAVCVLSSERAEETRSRSKEIDKETNR